MRRLALASAVLALATPAFASFSQVRARGEQLAAGRAAAQGDPATEKRLIEDLGQLVLEFIDDSDALQRGGREDAEKAAQRAAFAAVYDPLSALYTARSGQMEKSARAVMDADGDLEALYDSADWRTAQALAAQALYYLNWLEYYGARAQEGARRVELLQAAERGFSQFAVGEQSSELLAESLLGRGLCYLELGNLEWANRDFRLVIDKKATPERQAKARLALLDSYARGGNYDRTIAYAKELLNGNLVPEEDKTLIRFYQLLALFDAGDAARGARAEEYRREAGVVMTQLRRAGAAWASKVDAVLFSRIKDPAQWADKADTPSAQWELAKLLLGREDCATAEPLLEKVLAAPAQETGGHATEARYWLGVCRFKAARYHEAADDLAAALQQSSDAAFAADARYLRFKAYESLLADPANAALGDAYLQSIRDLVEHSPDHKQAYEARYRLGEYQQGVGQFAAAIAAYDAVQGDPVYVLRARFGRLQSRFELVRGEADPRRREELLAQVGQDLASYDEQAAALQAAQTADTPLAEFAPKVALLHAVHLSLSGGDNAAIAAALDDFAARFPDAADLLPQAVRMRLTALQRAGDFAAAEAEVKKSRQVLLDEAQGDALRALATAFAKSGRVGDPAQAQAAARVALQLHELADASGQTPSQQQRISIAQLQEQAGALDAAAADYEKILAEKPNAIAALRGLAGIAEQRGDLAAAQRHWAMYTEKVRGGDVGWFRGQYEQARLAIANGDAAGACGRLAAMRQAMPGLRDESLRQELTALFEQNCS